jgi:hypothetical protein
LKKPQYFPTQYQAPSISGLSRKWATTGPHCQDCETSMGNITASEHSQPSGNAVLGCRGGGGWRGYPASNSSHAPPKSQTSKEMFLGWAHGGWGEQTHAGASFSDFWQSRRS